MLHSVISVRPEKYIGPIEGSMTAWCACLMQLLLARQDAKQLQRSEPWMKHDPTAHWDSAVRFAANTRLMLRSCACVHMCVSDRHNICALLSNKAI